MRRAATNTDPATSSSASIAKPHLISAGYGWRPRYKLDTSAQASNNREDSKCPEEFRVQARERRPHHAHVRALKWRPGAAFSWARGPAISGTGYRYPAADSTI